MNFCRPFAGPVMFATIILAVSPVQGQSAALSDLRAKTELSTAELRIMDSAIDQLISRLDDDLRDNKGKALERFNEALRDDINDSTNTPTFRSAYVDRCASLCLERLQSNPGKLGYILLDSLSGLEDAGTLDAFLAAITSRDPAARFKGAAGIRRLSPSIPAERVGEVVEVLKNQAIAERNSVVLGRLYSALDFPTARDIQTVAIIDILSGRSSSDAGPDASALQAFNRLQSLPLTTLSSPDRTRLTQALALRLGIYVIAVSELSSDPSTAAELQSLVVLCERLLGQVTGAAGTGAIETALAAGDSEGLLKGLQGWIGCGDTAGTLNADPWQVPTAAGLTFDCAE